MIIFNSIVFYPGRTLFDIDIIDNDNNMHMRNIILDFYWEFNQNHFYNAKKLLMMGQISDELEIQFADSDVRNFKSTEDDLNLLLDRFKVKKDRVVFLTLVNY